MILEESDFKLKSDDGIRFDLELLRTINGKNGERKEFKNEGYSMPLYRALEKILAYRRELNHPETTKIEDYISECKQILEELKKIKL